jgi:hypothetical protein
MHYAVYLGTEIEEIARFTRWLLASTVGLLEFEIGNSQAWNMAQEYV